MTFKVEGPGHYRQISTRRRISKRKSLLLSFWLVETLAVKKSSSEK